MQLLAVGKRILERQVLVGKDSLLYLGGWQPGEKAESCPRTQFQRFSSTMKIFKGRKGKLIELNQLGRGSKSSLSSLCADFLLIGWCGGQRVVLQEFCAQPEVSTLRLGGGANSCRTQGYYYVYSLRRSQDTSASCTIVSLLLLFHFYIPRFPDKQLFESAFWNTVKVKEAERNLFLTNKKRGTQKGFVTGSPTGSVQFHLKTAPI